jgi:beta-lactamase regulating signal transducer with metallopeptidase domain
MNSWLSLVGAWLSDFGWIATTLLVAAAVMRLLLRDPGSRVLLAWGTWLAIGAGAVLTALPWWPRYEMTRLLERPAASQPDQVAVTREPPARPVIVDERPDVAAELSIVAAVENGPRTVIDGPILVTGIWIAAAAIACGWMLVGLVQALRLVKTSQAAPCWMVRELREIAGAKSRVAELRTSRWLTSAVAVGALRPRIVLPASSAVESNAKAIRAALAHEWAHICHGDLWLLALERLLVPLLAVHPLFWWLRRSTRLDQELLADAAAAGDKPVEYAEALIAWAKVPASTTVGLAALGMSEHPSNLSRRVQMILNCNRPETTRFRRLCGVAAAGVVLSLAGVLSTLTVHRAEADDEPEAPSASAASTEKAPPEVVEVALDSDSAATSGTSNDASSTSEKQEQVITLQVTLLALDRGEFSETKKEVGTLVEQVAGHKIEAQAESEQKLFRSSRQPSPKTVEIDGEKSQGLVTQLESVDGVKLICRARIIAASGQEAQINVTEPGPQVNFVQERDGKPVQWAVPNDVAYSVRVKPRVVPGETDLLELSVVGARIKPNTTEPQTRVKAVAGIHKTLIVLGSEPYLILVSPTNVKLQASATRSATGRTLSKNPAVAALPARATTQRPRPVGLPAPAKVASTPVPALPNPLAPGTVVPAVPFATKPAPVPNPAIVAQYPATSSTTTSTTAGAKRAKATILYDVNENATDVAERLGKRLREQNLEGVDVSVDSKSKAVLVVCGFDQIAAISKLVEEVSAPLKVPHDADRQTQRKLLELDLAEARLGVESAEVELAVLVEVRAKNPSAVSQQELRKRQLEVERAKIQVQRIQVQLEAASKPGESPAATPASAPKSGARSPRTGESGGRTGERSGNF